jgi:multiple sugar transport system permease protein
VRGFLFFRTVLFMPQTIATVVVAQAFTWIYAPIGPLNSFLRNVGAGSFAKVWLGDFTWALPAVGLIGTWISFGLVLILLLAGAQRIPPELYEAARVDGASAWQRFVKITLPLMKPAILVAVLFRTLEASRVFDSIFIMTRGAQNTESVSILGFNQLINRLNLGLGSAVSVLIFVGVVLIAFLFIKGFGVKVEEGRPGG